MISEIVIIIIFKNNIEPTVETLIFLIYIGMIEILT